MRTWIGIRDVNGGLERELAVIEESRHGKPARDHLDVGQMPSVSLVAARTRRMSRRVAVDRQDG